MLQNWMYSNKESLMSFTIDELSIPGTHDSGTYDMAFVLANPWAKTQNLNLFNQLNAGARALDIRIGHQPLKTGDNQFVLTHDVWPTRVTLVNALAQVLEFSKKENSEIIILDFHRLVELQKNGAPTDYTQLASIIKDAFGDYLIPESDKGLSLAKIWKKKGRIIVTWDLGNNIKDPLFWSGVTQDWYKTVTNRLELFQAIKSDMQKPHSGLWAVCAILPASICHFIKPLNPYISKWFKPNSDWSQKANIVYCDFINKTQLAQNLIAENISKRKKTK
jgi:1-phosphatidylinositol phosphodiesterase